MDHHDHVMFLRDGVMPGGRWADFGSGGGAFTLALADLLGPQGTIYSVDRNGRSLRRQAAAMQESFPNVPVHYIEADFTKRLDLPPLDGIVMANSLHFQRRHRQAEVLDRVYHYLKPGGHLLVVEYNSDRGSIWVPHPFSYHSWEVMVTAHGFIGVRQLHTRPSSHLREIYSALAVKKVGDHESGVLAGDR